MGETVASRVALKGTTFMAIVEAPNLVYEREPSDKHDRYAVAVSPAYGLALPEPGFVTGHLSIRDYKSISAL